MILQSIHISNYRLIKDLKVEFDPNFTLIIGANETGKSTITEALHRVLFLKARANTKDHEAMISTIHGGVPRVVLEFKVGNDLYRLTKIFGTGGSVSLQNITVGEELRGDEAERRLSDILGCETNLTKSHMLSSWSHHWILQGASSANPFSSLGTSSGMLIERMQKDAGTVFQSNKDLQVSKEIKDVCSGIFTSSGFRINSAVAIAERKYSELSEELKVKEERLRELENDIEQYEDSKKLLSDVDEKLQKASNAAESAQTMVSAIMERKKEASRKKNELYERRTQSQKLSERIQVYDTKRKEVDDLRTEITEKTTRMFALKQDLQNSVERLKKMKEEFKVLSDEFHTRFRQIDLVKRVMDLRKIGKRIAGLEDTRRKIDKLEALIKEKTEELSTLNQISQEDVDNLFILEHRVQLAEQSLRSASTSLSIIHTDISVVLGGEPMSNGETTVLHSDVILEVGDLALFKITPGAGKQKEELQTAVDKAREDLEDKLRLLEVTTIDGARDLLQNREALSAIINDASSQLVGIRQDRAYEGLPALNFEKAKLDITIDSYSDLPEFGKTVSEDDDTLIALLEKLEEGLEEQGKEIDEKKTAIIKLETSLDKTEEDVARLSESIDSKSVLLKEKETAFDNTYGSNNIEEDMVKLKECNDFEAILDSEIAALETEILTLGGDQPEGELKAAQNSLVNLKSQRDQILEKKSRLEGRLESHGSLDPWEEASKSRQAKEAAHLALKKEKVIADAWKLLADTIDIKQKELVQAVTRPLAERVEKYLRCVMGGDIKVNVHSSETGVPVSISIERNIQGQACGFGFDSLSGGTKEQVALAIRIAVLEFISGEYKDSLPLVVDEGLTHTDDSRLERLPQLVELARGKGVQLIVLAHRLQDFMGLTDKPVELQRVFAN